MITLRLIWQRKRFVADSTPRKRPGEIISEAFKTSLLVVKQPEYLVGRKEMTEDHSLRRHLTRLLDWHDAHADFDRVVADVPFPVQGVRPAGLPYSLWQLLEHMRLTQHDILDFCLNPQYQQPAWPADYWPRKEAPPDADAWERSVAAFRADRRALTEMVADPQLDLFSEIAHGEGQTLLREVLLVADHSAYHLGEMVALRRLHGVWE